MNTVTGRLPPSLLSSSPRPLIAALHQAPRECVCVREGGGGAQKQPGPVLLYAESTSPRETGLFPVHARWCPRGSS